MKRNRTKTRKKKKQLLSQRKETFLKKYLTLDNFTPAMMTPIPKNLPLTGNLDNDDGDNDDDVDDYNDDD